MKLVDLHPRWCGAGGEGITNADGSPVPERHGVAIVFDCPCGCGTYDSGQGCCLHFKNPLDGGAPTGGPPLWQREGDTFETLTLSPSILRRPASGGAGGCGWHGYIRNGEIVPC